MNDMCHYGDVQYMKIGSYICHRKPERTFKIRGRYFVVCSRCTGIYLGALAYFALVFWVYMQYSWVIILLALLMMIPTFTDGLTQLMFLRESNNVLRFFTGILAGIGLGIMVKALKYVMIF